MSELDITAPRERTGSAAQLAAILLVAGRCLIALLFVVGTLQKVIMPDAVQFFLSTRGWSEWLVWPALMLNTGGAVCLIFGIWLAPVALALAIYCMATSFLHFVPEDPWQMSIVVKNWAIAGGLLILAAHQLGQSGPKD